MNGPTAPLGLVRLAFVLAAAYAGGRGLRPHPIPPAPPLPAPPAPADPLAAKLKAAFDADAGAAAEKARAARDLAELYRQAAVLAKDPAAATAAALLERVRAAARTLVRPGVLGGTRAAVAAEVVAVLPADRPLDDEARAAAAALFHRIATALDGV